MYAGTPLSSIIEKHGVEAHNDEDMEHMFKIKESLAKTAIPVEKRESLMGMCVANPKTIDFVDSK